MKLSSIQFNKRGLVVWLALFLAVLISACSSKDYAAPAERSEDYAADAWSSAGSWASDAAAPINNAELPAERVIIWNASMDIEAKDASELHGKLAARVSELGGYEFSNDIQHHELYSVVNATFKVPPSQLQALLAYAAEEGKVVNRSLTSDDVTENYYDAQLRLESTRKTLEQYYKFMETAENLDEVLRLQRRIDEITTEIEAFEGRLRMWDILSDMATVSVYIRQENDPVKIQREINWSALSADDMGWLIKRGFVSVSSGVMTALQWIAVVVLITAPLWIPGLAVFWVILKRRKKRRAEPQNTEEDTD
jgi:hypothetical protein